MEKLHGLVNHNKDFVDYDNAMLEKQQEPVNKKGYMVKSVVL